MRHAQPAKQTACGFKPSPRDALDIDVFISARKYSVNRSDVVLKASRQPAWRFRFKTASRVLLGQARVPGERDCRQKLDELHPYAPQPVAVAADLEQLAKVELSIQLCMKLQRVMGARLDHLETG